MNLNDLNDLFRHMEWADASVWRAVLASDAARADTKLRELFYHVHMVQRAFLRVWQGETRVHAVCDVRRNRTADRMGTQLLSGAVCSCEKVDRRRSVEARSTCPGLRGLPNRSAARPRTRRSGKPRSKSRCTVCIIAAR